MTALEVQHDRVVKIAASMRMTVTVLSRPDVGSLFIQREWVLGDEPLAVRRGYGVSNLEAMDDRALAQLIATDVESMDRILVRKAAPVLVGRARSLRFTMGDLFQDVML